MRQLQNQAQASEKTQELNRDSIEKVKEKEKDKKKLKFELDYEKQLGELQQIRKKMNLFSEDGLDTSLQWKLKIIVSDDDNSDHDSLNAQSQKDLQSPDKKQKKQVQNYLDITQD